MIHHTGIAVESIEKAIGFYTNVLGMEQTTEIVHDPIQKVKVVLLAYPEQKSGPFIELVEPAGVPSPIDNVLKQNNHLYHICLEVSSLEATLQKVRKERAIIIQKPVPAKLFNGRKIAFVWTPTRHMIEYLEKE